MYHDWDRQKDSFINKSGSSLKSPGIHRFNGLILDRSKPIAELVSKSKSLGEFADNYFDQFGKKGWIEKTPANSYCFNFFLDQFEEGKVILMVRNPYDAIASMQARGLSVFKAASIYLANTLANLHLRAADYFHIVKYESLINQPQSTLAELCGFLNTSYESEMLNPMMKL